jgi:hypothetical protein
MCQNAQRTSKFVLEDSGLVGPDGAVPGMVSDHSVGVTVQVKLSRQEEIMDAFIPTLSQDLDQNFGITTEDGVHECQKHSKLKKHTVEQRLVGDSCATRNVDLIKKGVAVNSVIHKLLRLRLDHLPAGASESRRPLRCFPRKESLDHLENGKDEKEEVRVSHCWRKRMTDGPRFFHI